MKHNYLKTIPIKPTHYKCLVFESIFLRRRKMFFWWAPPLFGPLSALLCFCLSLHLPCALLYHSVCISPFSPLCVCPTTFVCFCFPSLCSFFNPQFSFTCRRRTVTVLYFCHTRAQLAFQLELKSCLSSACKLGHEVA